MLVLGFRVGLFTGARVGTIVGFGDMVGLFVSDVGFADMVGTDDGNSIGEVVGDDVAFIVGASLSNSDGDGVGCIVVARVGRNVGLLLFGRNVGCRVDDEIGWAIGEEVVGRDIGVGVINMGAVCGEDCGVTKNGGDESSAKTVSISIIKTCTTLNVEIVLDFRHGMR